MKSLQLVKQLLRRECGEATAGEVTAGEATGEISGEVTAGFEVTAGEVTAGEVTAGEVTAGEVTAGEVNPTDLWGDSAENVVSPSAIKALLLIKYKLQVRLFAFLTNWGRTSSRSSS